MYVCVSMSHMCGYLWRPEKGNGYSRAGVMDAVSCLTWV